MKTEAQIIEEMKQAGYDRKKKLGKKEPVYNLTGKQLDRIKQEATHVALKKAFVLVVHIACMVMRDKHGFGRKRLQDFVFDMEHMYKLYGDHQYTINDICHQIEEETGLVIDPEDEDLAMRKRLC